MDNQSKKPSTTAHLSSAALSRSDLSFINTKEIADRIKARVPRADLSSRSEARKALNKAMRLDPVLRRQVQKMVEWSSYGLRPLKMPHSPQLRVVAGCVLDHLQDCRNALNSKALIPIGIRSARPSTGHKAVSFGRYIRTVPDTSILHSVHNLGDRIDPLADIARNLLVGDESGAGALLKVSPIYAETRRDGEREQRDSLNSEGFLRSEEYDRYNEVFGQFGLSLNEANRVMAGDSQGSLQSMQYLLWTKEQLIQGRYEYVEIVKGEPRVPDVNQELAHFHHFLERLDKSRVLAYEYQWGETPLGTIAAPEYGSASAYEPIDLPASVPWDPTDWAEALDREMGGIQHVDPYLVAAAQQLIQQGGKKRGPVLEYMVLRLLARERREWEASAEFHREIHRERARFHHYIGLRQNLLRSDEQEEELRSLTAHFTPGLVEYVEQLDALNKRIAEKGLSPKLQADTKALHKFLRQMGYQTRQVERDLVGYVPKEDEGATADAEAQDTAATALKAPAQVSTAENLRRAAKASETQDARPRARRSRA